ncbi:MAG: RNA polymerase sigma factor [Armatimonadota bacterium]
MNTPEDATRCQKTFVITAPAYQPTGGRFDAFYDAHADRLFRLCLRLSGNQHAEAEDLAQEVLVAALQSLPRFAGRAQITTWLYTITVRTYRRRVSQREPSALALSLSDTSVEAAASRLQADRQSLGEENHLLQLSVAAAIADLPYTLREAFVLVKAEGFTHKEAARILDLPQGTVQARVHEAARRLRLVLAEEEPS